MGGRGASSGLSDKGKKYGSEYTTLYEEGNVKFVRYNDSTSAKTPQETMTRGRVYATVNDKNKVVSITYYDNENKRRKQIDLEKAHKGMLPHTHHGYEHNEGDSSKGAAKPTTEEKRMIERVRKIWYNNLSK